MWLKFIMDERPYYDTRNNVVLESIDGLRNRQHIDPFMGGGKIYPQMLKDLEIHSWQEKNTTLLVLVNNDIDIPPSEDGPQILTDEEVLECLKTEIGLPEDTTLDEDKKPVIPNEIDYI